jgi:hypothetical protein
MTGRMHGMLDLARGTYYIQLNRKEKTGQFWNKFEFEEPWHQAAVLGTISGDVRNYGFISWFRKNKDLLELLKLQKFRMQSIFEI